MDIDLPDTISVETIQRARPAIDALRAMLSDHAQPPGVTAEALSALLAIMDGVSEAATGNDSDLSPSDAAER